jgi:hypothetical protein
MEQWGWVAIVSAVVVFTLVQLVAYYYLTRGRGNRTVLPSTNDGSRSSPGQIDPADETTGPDERHPEFARQHRESGGNEDSRVRCEECGTPNQNDPMFTYCRNCGTQL